jgi:hypothetical protein
LRFPFVTNNDSVVHWEGTMRPKKHATVGESDPFRARLDQIINMKHEPVALADKLDWDWLDDQIAPLYSESGHLGSRAVSSSGFCCSSTSSRCPTNRTSDLARVTVDTTVQPKAITLPTDAKLLRAAIKGLNRLVNKHGVGLRQSYLRIAKRAAMMAGRYAHAKQFKRHRRELRLLRARLSRIIRDISGKVAGKAEIEAALQWPLARASQIRSQQQRQRGWKLYSFHAPEEVECIGNGKASAPFQARTRRRS